jgi:primosomal protein N' (replication factor Y)
VTGTTSVDEALFLAPVPPRERYATVAIALPFKFHSGGQEGLSYAVPHDLIELAHVGSRVLVPVGAKEKTGVIVELSDDPPEIRQKLKPITDVLDKHPVFDRHMLDWTKWVAKYYMCSWGEVLATALPEGFKPETKRRVIPTRYATEATESEIRPKAPKRAAVLHVIRNHPNGILIETLQRELKAKNLYSMLHTLEDQGFINIEVAITASATERMETVARLTPEYALGSEAMSLALTELERQAPRQANLLLALIQNEQLHPGEPMPVALLRKKAGAGPQTFSAFRERGIITVEKRPRAVQHFTGLPSDESAGNISQLELNAQQTHAVTAIRNQLGAGTPKTYLIHGVTGSGKTEVYISLVKHVLEQGRGALVLVPEIALTPQLIERFVKRLSLGSGEEIAVLHSRMSIAERAHAWRALQAGKTRLAIGARSAVFAPVRDLALIVVDEEHEATYKQYDKTPRYHARDIAVVRASMLNGVTILGSATPSLESYFNATTGKYELIELTERAKLAQMPAVDVVDLRTAENRRDFSKSKMSITPALRAAMKERLEKHEGIVLFQNRRGYSTVLECLKCGSPDTCPNCSVTLTYHRPRNQMRCHYCGYYSPKRTTCATCGSNELRLGGAGTQRVEDDVAKAFPEAKLLRMDLDTTSGKGAFQKLLTAFGSGEADILLGTQMVAKGLDFPRVTLVGVVNADTSLCLPDFRSGERTFQLLTQVSGRAGRTIEQPGQVLIQTLQPGHSAIALAVAHDFREFARRELIDRASLSYPPYSRLILVEFRGLHEAQVEQRANAFAGLFPNKATFYERIGPAPATIAKLRNEYRFHILIKDLKQQDPSGEKIRRILAGAIEQYQKRFASPQVKLVVDVDVQGVA